MKSHLYLRSTEGAPELSSRDFDGLVLGSEYCYFLLPDWVELEKAAKWSVSHSRDLTIILPYLRDHQVKSVVNSIREVSEIIKPKLIVNDWGTMWVLAQIIPGADLVVGRLLSGQKSCVRNENSPFLTDEGKRLLDGDIFSSENVREYLTSDFGVKSISVSATPLRLRERSAPGRVFHFPYVLVTVTDYCPYRNNLPSFLISSCSRLCGKGYVVLSNDSLGQVMYQRGKGRFFNPFPEGFQLPEMNDGEVIIYHDVP